MGMGMGMGLRKRANNTQWKENDDEKQWATRFFGCMLVSTVRISTLYYTRDILL